MAISLSRLVSYCVFASSDRLIIIGHGLILRAIFIQVLQACVP